MVNFTILAGGYNTFISAFSFVPGAESGSIGTLSLISQSNAGHSPSWIQKSPHNENIVYATNEVSNGQLLSFVIGEQGKVSLKTITTSGGNGPAHLLPLAKSNEVSILNYNSGDGLVVKLQDNLLDVVTNPAPPLIRFNPAPAAISHPHQAVEVGHQLFVPDLGADKIWRLNRTRTGTWNVTSSIRHPKGSGPRHIVVEDGIIYTLHELSSTLTSQKIPRNDENISPLISSSRITPKGANTSNFAAAEIQIVPIPTGASRKRYIYCSNRKTSGKKDPRGDSIAIFSLATNGSFKFEKQVFTGLQVLRGFVVDPSGRYMVAGGEIAGGVKVMELVNEGADLVEVAVNVAINASTFVWL